MGFESANFAYLPERSPVDGWHAFLLEKGAVPRSAGQSAFFHYVLKGTDHWIDLQIIHSGGERPDRVAVRIALCNPDQAIGPLLDLLRLLLEEVGGVVVDQHTGKRFKRWDQSAENVFRESFSEQQKRFAAFFGNRRAPIPADEVFDFFRRMAQSTDADAE